MQQHPSTRDAALQRGRRLAWTAAVGGVAAVGTLIGVIANAGASGAASSGGNAAAQPGGAQQQPSDSQSGGAQSDDGGLLPSQSQPGSSGGGMANAVTGGSGHRGRP